MACSGQEKVVWSGSFLAKDSRRVISPADVALVVGSSITSCYSCRLASLGSS